MSSASVSRLWLEASMDAAPIENGRVADWRLPDSEFLSSFSLPGLADKCDTLRDLHPLARDRRVVFYEDKHEYWIDGIKAPRSVTGLVHAYGWHMRRSER